MTGMFRGIALQPSWRYVDEVVRSLVGVLIAVLAALYWASPAAALAAGGSAAIIGATALRDTPHRRVLLALWLSIVMGVATFVGHLTAPHGVLFVATLLVWCFGAGMVWGVSANAGLVAAAATALVLTSPADGGALAEAALAGGLAVAGGLTQILLVAAWPRQRGALERMALIDAYRWVAASARQLAIDPEEHLDPTPLIELRQSVAQTERQARRRPPTRPGRYALPERIAMTQNALRPHAGTPEVRAVLLAAADVLTATTETGRSARSDAELGLRRLDDSTASLDGPVRSTAQRLRSQVSEAAMLHFTGSAVDRGPDTPLRPPATPHEFSSARGAIAAHLSGQSPVLRHAVRLAVAVAVGTVLARLTEFGAGPWMSLTVLLVVRPETAHTYTRCVARIAGVTAGVGVATIVTMLAHPTGTVCALLAVCSIGIAYAVSGFGSVPLASALGLTLVFLIDIGGAPDTTALGHRVVTVLLGGALAVAAHVALPDRSLVRIRQRSGELLKAENDYAATVIRAFVHEIEHPDEVLAMAWDRATRSRSAFEAASGSMRADAPRARKWLTAFRAALNAVTGVCATLETHLPVASPVALDPRFVVAVDDYVDALRGEVPSAGQVWTFDPRHLAEADQQLREAATLLGKQDTAHRVLVAETETITRHLLAVASLA